MIIVRYSGLPGTENRLIGFTKEDLANLVSNEVLLLVAEDLRLVLVYAEDKATLEASISTASSMVKAEAAKAAKGGHQC